MPWAVLDSVAFQGATLAARVLLLELARQHDGQNNGHLQLAMSWLSRRGWNSCDVVQRAKVELIDRGLVVETRKGGRNRGPSKYAVTWHSIENFVGLDIIAGDYRAGRYALLNRVPEITPRVPPHGSGSPAGRSSPAPANGAAATSAAPADGTKTAHSGEHSAPPDGRDVCIAIPRRRFLQESLN